MRYTKDLEAQFDKCTVASSYIVMSLGGKETISMDASHGQNGRGNDKGSVENLVKNQKRRKNNLISIYQNYLTRKFQVRSGKRNTLNPEPLQETNSISILPSKPISQTQSQEQASIMSAKSSPAQQTLWTSDTSKTNPTIISDLESATHSIQSIFRDLKSITPGDANTLLKLFTSEIKGVQNDDTLLLEKTVQLLSTQPETSGIGKSLTAAFINTLWDALPHPPMRSLGKEFKYRDADGGNNNIRMPDLGRAGTAYAKSVKAERPKKKNLPDPGELFDGLLRRGIEENGEGGFRGSPTGISSQLFYLATIIIHDLFLTVSSLVSFSILFGALEWLTVE